MIDRMGSSQEQVSPINVAEEQILSKDQIRSELNKLNVNLDKVDANDINTNTDLRYHNQSTTSVTNQKDINSSFKIADHSITDNKNNLNNTHIVGKNFINIDKKENLMEKEI